MTNKKVEKSIEIGGRKLTLTTGNVAAQADGAILASYGETVVLATIVATPLKNDLGYFPLTVEYQERLYAGGRIKGSRWVKREGRPTDEEILVSRLVDRSIRPLFPKDYKKDVQIVITVLSVDMENTSDIVAGVAASAAIAISKIPWGGPIGVVRIGSKDGKLITNPLVSESKDSSMDLVVSGTKEAIVMIEAGANEVNEKEILEGIDSARSGISQIIDLINDLVKSVGKEKEKVEKKKISKDIEKKVKDLTKDKIKKLIEGMATIESGYSDYDQVKLAVCDSFDTSGDKQIASEAFEELFKREIREMILSGKRPDGRKLDEIRKLSVEVGVLPRTHGSAIFNRGQTQVLSITTLGAPSLGQTLESAEGEETKRYIHHYNFPPYSTGETGRMGSPSRREIGHGALAERAITPVLPSAGDFPYAIRVVSEVLSSNGSTSMASACGSTLSLMDAGVPIKAPVGGIAMGLIVENEKKFVVLTDIVGIEDGYGDMDFKVAGSEKGITALQLDVKTLNLTLPILEKALSQAKEARKKILDVMHDALPKARENVSPHAPKIKVVKIEPEKIGELIGPGGKTIKRIIAETGAQVEVEDDGTVSISGVLEEEVMNAVKRVEALTKEVKAGEIYEGIVKRIQPFGAFIEVLPGKEGMVHVSDMSMDFVKDPSDLLKIGDRVTVRVKEIDDLGRINLSMLLDENAKKSEGNRGGGRDRDSNRGFRSRGRNDNRGMTGRMQGRSSGPHFPTSRFLEDKKKYS